MKLLIVPPQLTIKEARFNKRVVEKKIGRQKKIKNSLTLIYNWNGEQNECEAVKLRPPICCAVGQRQSSHLC